MALVSAASTPTASAASTVAALATSVSTSSVTKSVKIITVTTSISLKPQSTVYETTVVILHAANTSWLYTVTDDFEDIWGCESTKMVGTKVTSCLGASSLLSTGIEVPTAVPTTPVWHTTSEKGYEIWLATYISDGIVFYYYQGYEVGDFTSIDTDTLCEMDENWGNVLGADDNPKKLPSTLKDINIYGTSCDYTSVSGSTTGIIGMLTCKGNEEWVCYSGNDKLVTNNKCDAIMNLKIVCNAITY